MWNTQFSGTNVKTLMKSHWRFHRDAPVFFRVKMCCIPHASASREAPPPLHYYRMCKQWKRGCPGTLTSEEASTVQHNLKKTTLCHEDLQSCTLFPARQHNYITLMWAHPEEAPSADMPKQTQDARDACVQAYTEYWSCCNPLAIMKPQALTGKVELCTYKGS